MNGFHTSRVLLLYFQLSKNFNLGDIQAAEIVGTMVGKFDYTVREWRKQLLEEREVPQK